MFDKGNHGKIKKQQNYDLAFRITQYDYEIRHKPRKENIASDAFS